MPSIAPPTRARRSGSADTQRVRGAVASAMLAGALLGLAFLSGRLALLSLVAFVPLLVALDRLARRPVRPLRACFVAGWAFGFAWFLLGMQWIARLSNVAITVPWLKYPAWIVAAAYLALFPALAALLAGAIARRGAAALAVAFPCVFLAVEELRGSGELGFPWFQPGYALNAHARILQLASLGSVTLVTAWLLLVNVLLWRAVSGSARLRSLLGALLLLGFAWSWGGAALQAAPVDRQARSTIALVQDDIPSEMKWTGNHQPEILARFVALTDSAAHRTPRPVIAIWPETATGSYLRKQLDQALQVVALASRTGVPVFSGFADFIYDSTGTMRHFNAAGVFAPDGSLGEIYGKRHLVPFGERMPFERVFPWLAHVDLGQAEWTAGPRPVLFPVPGLGPFACLICFESIFPDLSRDAVRGGAQWLVNITNDEWFGNGPALPQHAAMAQFRAVENHVPLARCANTGITEIIDAEGRVVARLPVFQPASLVRALPPRGLPTPYTRFGDWPGAAALIATGLMLARALARPRRDATAAR